ncbi:MAG: MBOAT family O-acyltransferase [Bacteroidota bacterium]
MILLASYVFYGWWDWRFLSLIAFSTVVDYFLGWRIHESQNPKQRKWFLSLSLIANLSLLGFFKYYNFFIDSLQLGIQALGVEMNIWTLNIILPVGISFYTFQTLSYSIDIYYKKFSPTQDFIAYSAFVSFFPQLVAGPIERASHLIPQFISRRTFDLNEAIRGISLITYGFFRKVVIADRLAIYVDAVFNQVDAQNSVSLFLGLVFFSLQIYCDFSGYSLIARGVAKLFGFDIMINFNKPYIANSITDFWRRWHISLSTWFRDYVYIPLGGNRVSLGKHYQNIMIVFLVSGLWHGANWTFIVWGALHGLYQLIYLLYVKFKPFSLPQNRFRNIANILIVYFFVCIAWVFFRAESVEVAIHYLQKLSELSLPQNLMQLTAEKGPFNLLLSFFGIGLLAGSYLFPDQLQFKKRSYHLAFTSFTICLIILLGINGKPSFIYFQF